MVSSRVELNCSTPVGVLRKLENSLAWKTHAFGVRNVVKRETVVLSQTCLEFDDLDNFESAGRVYHRMPLWALGYCSSHD